MAPARTSNRRAQRDQNTNPALLNNVQSHQPVDEEKTELFLEPMMGTPLALYVDKDVEGRDQIVELITVGTHSIGVPFFFSPFVKPLGILFGSLISPH